MPLQVPPVATRRPAAGAGEETPVTSTESTTATRSNDWRARQGTSPRVTGAAANAPQVGGLSAIMDVEFAQGLTANITGLKPGVAVLSTGNPSWTRSYGQRQSEVFKVAHGSARPASIELEAHSTAPSPGRALDAMAKAMGLSLGFQKMADSAEYSDRTEKRSWWGLCHSWSWAATHPEISKKVDVDGPEGMKGRWFAGQFISRADLGNWMMAVGNHFALDSMMRPDAGSAGAPDALQVFKAVVGTLQPGMHGFVADIHNDQAEGTKETWNQPFNGARVETVAVSAAQREKLLAHAKKLGIAADSVHLVKIDASYAAEVSDDYEGAPSIKHKHWNMYVFDNKWGASGALPANDPALRSMQLPVTSSDPLPDYVAAMPTGAIDDALAGILNPEALQIPHAKEFNFFVGTVLKHSVTAVDKRRFEVELSTLTPGANGRLSAAQIDTLATRYPDMANAFAPSAWKKLFTPLGLDAKRFGSMFP